MSLFLITPSALAEEIEELITAETTAAPSSTEKLPFDFVVEAGMAGQGKADVDGGGDMQVTRFDMGVIFTMALAEKTKLSSSALIGFHDYDFDNTVFGSAWGTINLSRIGLQVSQQLNEKWAIRAGGVVMSSRETGADFSDSFTGGATLGVDYRYSDTLFLSLGAAVVSQLEDDAIVTPSVVLNWKASDRWTLRLGALPVSGGTGAGLEGEYKINESLAFGVGLLPTQRRFRLDDSGTAPNGIGEENNLAIRARLGWRINDLASVHLLAGISCAGKLRLEDQGGSKIAEEDYDPAPYVALRAVFRF